MQKPFKTGPLRNIKTVKYNNWLVGFNEVLVMGWGSDKWFGSGEVDNLQINRFKVINYQDPKKMFIKLSQRDGHASCDGDSGGMSY